MKYYVCITHNYYLCFNKHGTALHLAIENGHTATAELLISKGADINAKNWVCVSICVTCKL